MSSALLRQASPEEILQQGARDAALRSALDEARQIAAQTRLLALNTAFESAGAPAGEGDAAGVAAAEAEKMANAVELLLEQIQSASFPSGPL